jgi:hypothetical protein
MFRVTSNVCHNHDHLYVVIPAFVDGVNQLDDNIVEINRNSQQQSGTIPKGASSEKNFAIDLLAQEAVKVANGIYVYAYTSGDRPLQTKVSVNKSMFYTGHDNDALVLAKNIADEAHKYAEELAEYYGIEEDAIKALDEAVAGFELVINKPIATIGKHKLYTGNLKQLFAETDSVLCDRLDKLITLFKTSDPEFYFLYKNARNVINTAQRSGKAKEY